MTSTRRLYSVSSALTRGLVRAQSMIDNFSILLSHGLLAIAFWLLLNRPDLDIEEPPTPDAGPAGFAAKRNSASRKKKSAPDA